MNISESTLMAGFTLRDGRYRIEEVLGTGGFGITYRAWDANLDLPVALKEFFPTGAYRENDSVRYTGTQLGLDFHGALKDFVREAQLLARLRHTNIVRLFDHFEELGTGFMVMEYLSGQTYEHQVSTSGPLSETDTLSVLRFVGQSLAAMHRAGLVHRDVKPSNIMGTDAMGTDEGRVVLIDFGSSRFGATNVSALASKSIVSNGYSPIEQYSNAALTPASDVYALAATGYFLLCGTPPSSSLERASGTAVDPVASRNPTVTSTTSAAISAGLGFGVTERPQSIDAFLALFATTPNPDRAPSESNTKLISTQSTVPSVPSTPGPTANSVRSQSVTSSRPWLRYAIIGALLGLGGLVGVLLRTGTHPSASSSSSGTSVAIAADPTPSGTTPEVPITPTTAAPMQRPVVVPDVKGAEAAEALHALQRAGLIVIQQRRSSTSLAKGFVLDQDPLSGAAVTAGDTLTIVVSTGPPGDAANPTDTVATSGGKATSAVAGAYGGVVEGTNGADDLTNNTGEGYLSVRRAPRSGTTEIRRIYEGDSLSIACQVNGTNARSSKYGSSTVWDRLDDGNYVAHIYVNSPQLPNRRAITVSCNN
jgi:serine/threonine protein kinase